MDRSTGRYRQTKAKLCQKDGDRYKHCCLGVLCEVEGIVPNVSVGGYKRYHGADEELPRSLAEKFGVKSSWVVDLNPIYGKAKKLDTKLFNKLCKIPNDERDKVHLTNLNDDQELTFKEIAKVLRLVYNIR